MLMALCAPIFYFFFKKNKDPECSGKLQELRVLCFGLCLACIGKISCAVFFILIFLLPGATFPI